MRVRLTLDVDDLTRFVVARYFRAIQNDGRKRTRSTRAQVRLFAQAAMRDAVSDRIAAMDSRGKAVARRLIRGTQFERPTHEPLSAERQPSLW
jgi:hypothetical protein